MAYVGDIFESESPGDFRAYTETAEVVDDPPRTSGQFRPCNTLHMKC